MGSGCVYMITFGYDLESTGPDPFENKIVTIQYRRNKENYVFKIWDYDQSERELISRFLKSWESIPLHLSRGGDYFVMYNLRLCAPFLLTRCILNDIGKGDLEERKHLWNCLVHTPAFLDLYQLLGDKFTRFDHWRKLFGLGTSSFKNSDIPHLYNEKRYLEIEDYVCDELVAMEKLYDTLSKESFFAELEKLRIKLDQ